MGHPLWTIYVLKSANGGLFYTPLYHTGINTNRTRDEASWEKHIVSIYLVWIQYTKKVLIGRNRNKLTLILGDEPLGLDDTEYEGDSRSEPEQLYGAPAQGDFFSF